MCRTAVPHASRPRSLIQITWCVGLHLATRSIAETGRPRLRQVCRCLETRNYINFRFYFIIKHRFCNKMYTDENRGFWKRFTSISLHSSFLSLWVVNLNHIIVWIKIFFYLTTTFYSQSIK